MKLFAIVLAAYMLLLMVLPCVDRLDHAQSQKTELISTKNDQTQQEESDFYFSTLAVGFHL